MKNKSIFQKENRYVYLIAILLPLVVGGFSAFLTSDNMNIYKSIVRPPLSPPSWVFPVVWTILYILMGIASAFIWLSNDSDNNQTKHSSDNPLYPNISDEKDRALTWYMIQLLLNFFWSIIFFNWRSYWLAFVWILLLWWAIFKTWDSFRKIDITASRLLIPYLIWVTFAAYLTLATAILN